MVGQGISRPEMSDKDLYNCRDASEGAKNEPVIGTALDGKMKHMVMLTIAGMANAM